MIDDLTIQSASESQLADARETLAATGKSPRQIGAESKHRVLEWIYRWGYSSPNTIQQVLDRTSAGYAKRLSTQGFLVETKTKSGVPQKIFTLSELGLQEAERHAYELLRYPELDPYKVNQQLIRHNLFAQSLTASALISNTIVNFETERMFATGGDESGIKRPDVIWITETGQKVGIEVELTAKWARDLDEFVLGIGRALKGSPEFPAKYDRFAIFSDSQAIISRYRSAMRPGAPLQTWKKNNRGHWEIEAIHQIPDWLIEKIDFHFDPR